MHRNNGRRRENRFVVLRRNLIQLVVLVLFLRDEARLIGERRFHPLNVVRVIGPRVRRRYDGLRGRDRVFRRLKRRHVATPRRIVPGRRSVSVPASQTVPGSQILEFLQIHVGQLVLEVLDPGQSAGQRRFGGHELIGNLRFWTIRVEPRVTGRHRRYGRRLRLGRRPRRGLKFLERFLLVLGEEVGIEGRIRT